MIVKYSNLISYLAIMINGLFLFLLGENLAFNLFIFILAGVSILSSTLIGGSILIGGKDITNIVVAILTLFRLKGESTPAWFNYMSFGAFISILVSGFTFLAFGYLISEAFIFYYKHEADKKFNYMKNLIRNGEYEKADQFKNEILELAKIENDK